MNQPDNIYKNLINSPVKDARSGSKGFMISTMWFLAFVKNRDKDLNKVTVLVKGPVK